MSSLLDVSEDHQALLGKRYFKESLLLSQEAGYNTIIQKKQLLHKAILTVLWTTE